MAYDKKKTSKPKKVASRMKGYGDGMAPRPPIVDPKPKKDEKKQMARRSSKSKKC